MLYCIFGFCFSREFLVKLFHKMSSLTFENIIKQLSEIFSHCHFSTSQRQLLIKEALFIKP